MVSNSDYTARLAAVHQRNGTTPCPVLAARLADKRKQHSAKRPKSNTQQFLNKLERTIKAAFGCLK